MSDESLIHHPRSAVLSSKERTALVAKALSEAARRARFSTRRRRSLTSSGFRARSGDRLFRTLRVIAFLALVVLPTSAAGVYYGLLASDQYVAEARFTVRGGTPPAIDRIGALTGAPSMLIIQDTQVIMNYLESRSLVESLDRSVGLQTLYGRDDIDWLSRLKHGRSIEKVVKYWKSHIDLTVQMPAGIVVFTVRAFAPDDAVKLADSALEAGEQLVNRMNDQMRADAVALAEKERQRAQDNLAAARAGLERARNEEGILSADVASNALSGLMTEVKGGLIKLQQQYESQRRFVDADAPQLQSLQAKISAAEQEVAKLQDRMTSGAVDRWDLPRRPPPPPPCGWSPSPARCAGEDTHGVVAAVSSPVQRGRGTMQSMVEGVAAASISQNSVDPMVPDKVLSGSMSRLDEATFENTIAEKIYAGSLAALEHARLASEAKLMYINTFVRPVAAEDSKYPRRVLFISLVALIGFATWGTIAGLLGLARNRLA